MIADQTLAVVTRVDREVVQTTDVGGPCCHRGSISRRMGTGPHSGNPCCQTSGAPATSAKRGNPVARRPSWYAGVAYPEEDPTPVVGTLRLAMLMPHLLQLPRHRGEAVRDPQQVATHPELIHHICIRFWLCLPFTASVLSIDSTQAHAWSIIECCRTHRNEHGGSQEETRLVGT